MKAVGCVGHLHCSMRRAVAKPALDGRRRWSLDEFLVCAVGVVNEQHARDNLRRAIAGWPVPRSPRGTRTHGASVVGFACTELLGFRLLPRLKNIGSIRLYRR